MGCIVGKGIVICGDFHAPDGEWHDLGYMGIMHQCFNCSLAARFVRTHFVRNKRGRERQKDQFWCGKCQIEGM